MYRTGFTILELLITIAILAVLSTLVFVYVFPALAKARDVRRIFEISNIGRFVVSSCPLPTAGPGDYDIADLVQDLRLHYPKYAGSFGSTSLPKDPSIGTETQTYYHYIVDVVSSTRKCALYANLENASEGVTISGLSMPTAGGGTGVLETASPGWNHTPKYYQISN